MTTTPLDTAYQAQRIRLTATVTAATASAWAQHYKDRNATIQRVVGIVTAGQAHTVRLVDSYMTAKAVQATGSGTLKHLDPKRYITDILRGLPAAEVYSRPFGAYGSFLKDGAHPKEALRAAQSSVSKLAATDLQLAQTHSARDWMQHDVTEGLRIVGYRRVLSGPGPHCSLCTAASTRTYKISDLLPIHEHCTCTAEPLWGTEPVPSIGTTVRVDVDPELGPRLMADDWTPVGPRLNLDEEHPALDRHVVDVTAAMLQ